MSLNPYETLKMMEGLLANLQSRADRPEAPMELGDAERQWLEKAGYDMMDQGQWDNARTLFGGLVAYTDRSFYAYVLGVIEMKDGKFEEALRQFNICAAANPSVAKVYFERGLVLATLGKDAEARADFEKAIKLDPDQRHPMAKFAQAVLDNLAPKETR